MKQVSNNNFITQIKTLLQNAREKVYINVNDVMTKTYYEIGKKIVEEEQLGSSRAKYGKELLKNLSNEPKLCIRNSQISTNHLPIGTLLNFLNYQTGSPAKFIKTPIAKH
jgi:hypothetical protein